MSWDPKFIKRAKRAFYGMLSCGSVSELFDKNFESMLEDYKRGALISDLADKYNISAPTITKWLKKTNNYVKRAKWAQKEVYLSARFGEITHMYEDGAALNEIAKVVGVSAPTIRNWLIKGGYIRKKRGKTPLAMKARAHDLSNRGWPTDQIALLFKENVDLVNQWLNQPAPRVKRQLNPKSKPKNKYIAPRVKNPSGQKPPRHKCKRRWTGQEIDYVFDMIQEGYGVKEIYQQTGASRARQNKILQLRGGVRPFVPKMPKAPKARPIPPPPRYIEREQLPEEPYGRVTQLSPQERRALEEGSVIEGELGPRQGKGE